MTSAPEPSSAKLLVAQVGVSFFPVALLARLPYAMMVIGVLTLVVSARGSVELGGVNSAMVGIGVACIGPLIGAAADRFGQRPTLLISGATNSAFLGLFAWIAYSDLSNWAMFACAFLIGASAPQPSPMSRSRIVSVIAHKIPVARQPRLLSTMMAYESAVDETIFVFGPVIVGALAVTMGAWAPVVGAGILTLVFVGAFALHHTSAPAKSAVERAKSLDPVSHLFRPGLIITVLGITGVGFFFGSTLTSLTAFMLDRGEAEGAGLTYSAMGIGSAILAFCVAFLPPSFSLRTRWVAFSLIIVGGGIVLQTIDSVPGMVLSLALMGFGIGPTLVTLYSFGAARSPEGRSATVMTMLGSGIVVGQSAASWITGLIAEDVSTQAALWLPLGAGILVLIAGVVNWWIDPSPRARAR